jgi:hypothetical protein
VLDEGLNAAFQAALFGVGDEVVGHVYSFGSTVGRI